MSGRGFVAVHVGAGYHSPANSELYKQVCKTACHQALEMLKQKKSALDAVTVAIMALEDSPWTNAGTGSNLTITGHVECDASIMDGESLHYGAVGAVTGVKNPIRVADNLLKTQMLGSMSLGRIPPSTLVGPGAREWARKNHIPVSKQEDLLTDASKRAFIKHKRKLDMLGEGLPPENNKRTIKMDHSSSRGDAASDGQLDPSQQQSVCPMKKTSCVTGNPQQAKNTNNPQQQQNITSNLTQSTDGQNDNCLYKKNSDINDFSKETLVISNKVQKLNCTYNSERAEHWCMNHACGSSVEGHFHTKQQERMSHEMCQAKDMNTKCVFSLSSEGCNSSTSNNGVMINREQDNKDCTKHGSVTVTDREDNLLDTVGAICVDESGQIASGVSSGGIVLKQPGRLGQAALYGCGCWAECNQKTNTGIGVSTSGCGEHLTKTLIARECAESMNRLDDPVQGVAEAFQHKFLDSHFLQSLDQKLGGALGVKSEKSTDKVSVEVLWAHTTDSMCLAYMSTQDKQPKAFISRLPEGKMCGKSFLVQSKHVTIPLE